VIHMLSDPNIPDIARNGDDLLARIDELASVRDLSGADGNGWIFLLLACKDEILRLRRDRIRRLILDHAPDEIKSEMLSMFPESKRDVE
jgi:hypothetical protein